MNTSPQIVCPKHRPRKAKRTRAAVALLSAVLVAAPHMAKAADEEPGQRFGDLSIEQLMNESVTSVSKKEEKLTDAAAAITVLTNEEIRRSGATSIPEALRLVPGMDVAAVNAREWAVTARGFNGVFANKLLVLVDGRSVYTPLFAGVLWDQQQTPLADLDRIEAIRGPGATLWGANAVNGVINVVSRSARDTQGALVYAGGGNVHETMDGARYGGKIGENTYYRAFGSYQSNNDYPLADGQSAKDGWQGWNGGFRTDHYSDTDTHLTWQADASGENFNQGASSSYNVNTIGRWTRQLSGRSSVEVQAYFDRTHRDDSSRLALSEDTFDLAWQHNFGLGERNDVIWGLGYRFVGTKIEQATPSIQVRNGDFGVQLFSAFVQDEFRLVPDRLTLTAGVKLEHHDIVGFEIQPSVRAVFKPTQQQTMWAAVSRAVRTPDEVESKDVLAIAVGAPFVGPGGGLYTPAIVGNGHPSPEVLLDYELGYRIQPANRVSVDLAAFYNRYSDLIAIGSIERFVPGTPVGTAEIPITNLLDAHSYGSEAAVTVSPTDSWRLTAGYSLIVLRISGPVSADQATQQVPPRHQVSLKSSYDFSKRASFDAQLRYVDSIQSVPAYATADARFSYRLTDQFELALAGQNLFAHQHPEQGPQLLSVTSEVPRGLYGRIVWRY